MNKMTTMNDGYDELAKQIVRKPYARKLTPDLEGGYTASILEFPGCFAEGDDAKEALDNLELAAESWVTASLASGQNVRDPICFDGLSGKIALRIPRGLHQQIAEMAELEDCSLNQLLTSAVAEFVGRASAMRAATMAIRSTIINLQNVEIAKGVSWKALRDYPTDNLTLTSSFSLRPLEYDGSRSLTSGVSTLALE